MRLLLVAQQFRNFRSGLGTYARGLAEGLVARGVGVTVATCREEAEETEGIRLVPMEFSPWNLSPGTWRRMGDEVRRVVAAEAGDHDIVHFLDAREAGLLRGRPGLPVVGTVHDTYALDWRGATGEGAGLGERLAARFYYGWLRGVEKVAYSGLSLILANSEHVVAEIGKGYVLPRIPMEVIRLGLPDAAPAVPEALVGDPAILFVGGNFRRKGLPVLLRALAAVREELPDAKLHVVGADRRAPKFEALAVKVGVRDRVEFLGHRENERVRSLMAGADVFAMPSEVEAFGLVYLEAMRAGTPVIATARGGAAEVFTDGEEALLTPPGDARALAGLLLRLHGDTALRERLIAGGRAAAARMTVERTVEETVAAYERLLV